MTISNEIKQRVDVVNLVSEYVQLEKAGRNFKALCPFHTEKTPSFFVFPERQTWRCFGCGAGGDLISFVMKKEGLDFGEAIKTLAQKAGVPLFEKQPKTTEDEETAKSYRINEAAAQYYHQMLLTSPAAQTAREYMERRGLTKETIKDFQLGFSLDEWEGLKQQLRKQGYKDVDLVAAGIAIEKEGRIYDRFRGRFMFPINNAKGQVVGFGARALDDAVMPKYLNSAESPVFNKSSILYGMNLAKRAIREQGKAVIVEGYMDVLTAHQNGFRNVVASMGTSLTEKQIAVLKDLTKHICLSLDPDVAGDAATLRGIEVCRNALSEGVRGVKGWLGKSTALGANIDIISLPEGKDPDDVIRDNPTEWQNLVDAAQSLMDYLFVATAKDLDLSRPEGQSELAGRLLPLIAEMADSVVRDHYLAKLVTLTGLAEKTLVAKLAERIYPIKGPRKRRPETVEVTRPTRQVGDQLEEYCLCLLGRYPSLRGTAGNLSPDHFERSENREIFIAWQRSQGTDDVWGNIDTALHKHFQSLIDRDQPPFDKGEQAQALADCIRRMEERRLRYQLVFEAESALGAGDVLEESSARLTELQRQHTTLR